MKVLIWLSIGLDRRTPSEHLLAAITNALGEEGHSVHILQKDSGGPRPEMPEQMSRAGATTTRIRCAPSKRRNLAARYLEDIGYVLKCRKWIRKNAGFDRVFMQSSNVAGLQVFFLRRILGDVPVTFNVQDIFPENAVYSNTLKGKGLLYRLFSAIQRYAYRKADRIITISEDMRDQLEALGVPSGKISTVYNWSYRDEPYRREDIDFSGTEGLFEPDKFNVVYAGNIGRMQHVEVILQTAGTMREDKDIVFHVFGEGVYRDRLRQTAQEEGLDNVVFHPMLDAKDAPALYAAADVNVIPLLKEIYRTALPSKTATCLACGKPIIMAIGSESRFGKELSENADVLLTDSDDLEGIRKAILRFKAGGMESKGSAYYRSRFSITANSRRYADIIIG